MSELSLTDVSYCINANVIVQKVSLSVVPGDWLCIAGCNGSGKSTVLKLMAGLVVPKHFKNISLACFVPRHIIPRTWNFMIFRKLAFLPMASRPRGFCFQPSSSSFSCSIERIWMSWMAAWFSP